MSRIELDSHVILLVPFFHVEGIFRLVVDSHLAQSFMQIVVIDRNWLCDSAGLLTPHMFWR